MCSYARLTSIFSPRYQASLATTSMLIARLACAGDTSPAVPCGQRLCIQGKPYTRLSSHADRHTALTQILSMHYRVPALVVCQAAALFCAAVRAHVLSTGWPTHILKHHIRFTAVADRTRCTAATKTHISVEGRCHNDCMAFGYWQWYIPIALSTQGVACCCRPTSCC